MDYTIAVYGSPYAGHSHQHALKFCEALFLAGHSVTRVFFYHEAVYVALATRVAPQDEIDVTAHWSALQETHDFELNVCIANALKRGVVDESEAQRYEKSGSVLAEGFELAGLGQLIDGMLNSDRFVEFHS